MDLCDFWYANRCWIWLTCDTVMFGHHTSEWPSGTLIFRWEAGGWLNRKRRVTKGSEAGDSDFRLNSRGLELRYHSDRSAVESAKSWVSQRTTHSWRSGGPSQFWVVRQSVGSMKSINIDWYLYSWMLSSKCYTNLWYRFDGFHNLGPLKYWGLCLPHGHMISGHPWKRLSAFILKYFFCKT